MTRNRSLVLVVGAGTFALSYVVLRALDVRLMLKGGAVAIDAAFGAAVITGFVVIGCLLLQAFLQRQAKKAIKAMFGTYISPALVDQMVESSEEPKLGGREVEMTPYFSDLQNFAAFSPDLTSAQLVELMNDYLTACTDAIQAEGGTLDKYVGDAVIAMFGAPIAQPDHAYRACVASQRAQLSLAELREKWRRDAHKWPSFLSAARMRVGLNSGLCVVGNMGSRTRFNYTMMGDNVNLAARMELGATNWGAFSMCTESTRAACVAHGGDRVVFRPLGKITIKGRLHPLPIHEIAGLKETIDARTRECLGIFADGLDKYHARDWDGAIQRFQQSAPLEPNLPGTTPGVRFNPSLVYLGICQDYKAHPPPENWNGTFVMTTV